MKRRSYQQGSVVAVEKKGKIVGWDFRWREDGQQKSVRLGSVADFPLKAKAEKAAESYRARINENREVYRFRDLAIRWEQNELPERMDTRDGYLSNLRRLRERWDDVRLDDMAKNVYEVEVWLNGLQTMPGHGPIRPLAKKTKNNIKWFLHGMFARAIAWGMLPVAANPIQFLKVKGKDKAKLRDLVEPEDFYALMQDAEIPLVVRVMIAVAVYTGMRVSEILGLRWEAVDLMNGVTSVEKSSVGRHVNQPKTDASEEFVPMHPALIGLMVRWQAQLPSVNGWVFGNPVTGRPYWADSQQEHLREAGKRLGLVNLGWHSFRHTYRAMMAEKQVPMETQKHLMRHSSIQMTEKYGRRKGAMLEVIRPVNAEIVKSLPMPESIPALKVAPSKSKSGYYGVYPEKGRYTAKMSVKGKKEYIGFFETAEEAAKSYDKRAFELKGNNAALNFPEDYAGQTVTSDEISTEEAEPLGELVLN